MEDEINLLDYWRMIVKWKKVIMLIVSLATLAAIITSLLMSKVYKAEATIIPLGGQKSGGMAGLIAAQMGLGGLLGGVGGGGSSNSLMAILKSRTLAEQMIEKHDLIKVLYPKAKEKPSMEDVVRNLFGTLSFKEDKKEQVIVISAEFENPDLAASLVNDYLRELMDYLNNNALTMAKRNRIFIEGQLERSKLELLESGKELSDFYAVNKISSSIPTVNVDVSIDKTGDLLKQSDALGEKIREAKTIKNVPQQVYLQYLTLRRELLGQVNSLLTQQYEMAKIDEQKEDLNFQVIDWARVPVRKFKPKRAQIVMTAFIMSLFLGVVYAFLKEYSEKMKERTSQKEN